MPGQASLTTRSEISERESERSMTTISDRPATQVWDAPTSDYLEALHHYGYSVNLQSPKTSPDRMFMVCAYSTTEGAGPESIRSSHEHLHEAIKGAAEQLYGARLGVYLQIRSGK